TANISLYPNPATNHITISADEAISTINIVDRMGRMINTVSANGTQSQIDLSNLSSGIYVAKINLKDNKGFAVKTFVVE
ncbi:T9SS type A sorting domain-containing protein, partial [Vibrio parahaemolyticus]